MDGARERAIEAGCSDYDVKPIELPANIGTVKVRGSAK